MMEFMRSPICIAAIAVQLGACSLAPSYERPQTALPASLGPAPAQAAGEDIELDWWKNFKSAELDRLMDLAINNNNDLVAAYYRVEQARASVKQARGSLVPAVDGSFDVSRDRATPSTGPTRASTDSGAGLRASYELDLWGRLRNSLKSRRADFRASEFDRRTLLLIIEADVVTTYAQALAIQDRLVIARRNIEAARDVLALVEAQYDAGAISGLELAQQRAALAGFEADIPALESSLASTLSALAVLTGGVPQDFRIENTTLASLHLPFIAPTQPSSLLERRPDIARAEAQLEGANADIGVAQAAYFPTVDLSASLLFSDIVTGGMSRVASLGSSVFAPIFQGGQIDAEVDRTKARFGELEASYQQTVLIALKEAYDALVAAEAAKKQVETLDVASRQSARALELAQLRYRYGAEGFQTVLESQRSALSAQDRFVQQQFAQISAAATLYKALGGGWNNEDISSLNTPSDVKK